MEMISLRDPKLNVECKKKLAARMAEWNGETESRLAKSATFPSTSDTSSDTTRWSVSKHSLVGPRPLCRIISTIDHTYWSLCIELNQSHRYWIIINKLVEDNNNTVASTNSLQTNSVSLLLKRQAEPFECHSKVYYTIARRTLIIRVGSEKSATTKAALDFPSQQQVCLPLLSSPVLSCLSFITNCCAYGCVCVSYRVRPLCSTWS